MGTAAAVLGEDRKNNWEGRDRGRGRGAAGEILAQQRGLGLGMQLQQRMLSRILFQADWRQECVLCHRRNVPSDRTANRAR